MAEPAPLLKDGFSAATVRAIAERLLTAAPGFDSRAFVRRCLIGFDDLSLMERVHRVAEAMVASLPQDYPEALAIVECALGEPPRELLSGEGIAAFRWAPFLEFVALAGRADPVRSLPALSRLTRHFTAEFAIRPFLDQHLELSRQHIAGWVTHADPRVRRLASEGTRPLLPWGKHIAALKREPHTSLVAIAALASDPSEMVRRSAANHLNDVSRLAPELALDHARQWYQQGETAASTVRHALRTLVKKGHPGALGLLGYDVSAAVVLSGLAFNAPRVAIGGTLLLQATLTLDSLQPVLACVDYAVRYASARGADRLKVFKGGSFNLMPGEPLQLNFKRDFVPRTTRALYPGPHAVQVLVNGVVLGESGFELTA
jgi:3-methyladenine DNA glycosylase AlkC